MKPFHYITIGVVATLIVLGVYSFRGAEIAADGESITLSKRIESSDPACLQMYYHINRYADTFNIPIKYAFGIAHVESSYNGPFHWNYNHKLTSYAGAVGPMQIMPSTAKFINKEKVSPIRLKSDVEYNVKTSMKLLRYLYDQYGDWKLVFGAYNTGHPCVNGYALKVYSYEPSWMD